MKSDTLFEAVLGNGKTLKSGPGGSILTWSIESDYLISTDAWSFDFVSATADDRSALELMPVELYLDGRLQLAGRVDVTRKGKSGKVVSVSGRDYIADFVEGQVDPSVKIAEGDRLDQVILQVLKPYGVVAIEEPERLTTERTGKPPSNKLPKLVKADMQNNRPQPNSSAYQYCNHVLARHGYTLQPSVNRSLVSIEYPNYLQSPVVDIVRLEGGRGGNVIESEAVRDCSSFPTYAKFIGSAGKAVETASATKHEWSLHAIAPGLAEDIRQVVTKWCWNGLRLPKNAPNMAKGELYRLMTFQDKLAKTPAQIACGVTRAAFDQLKKSLSYEVRLFGTKDPKTEVTYAINTMATVADDIADVHEMLWCYSCHRQGGDDGCTTAMKFWRPGSYQIDKEGHG